MRAGRAMVGVDRGGPGEAGPVVLVVDDQELPRRALRAELEEVGFRVLEAGDGREALALFREAEPDVIVTDLVMPRADGIDLLSAIRERSRVPVVVFTSQSSVDSAVAALRGGADDFVVADGCDIDELVARVVDAARGAAQHVPGSLADRLPGRHPAIRRARERLLALAPLGVPLLIAGEPGTGRDTAARAVHALGPAPSGEFLRVEGRRFERTSSFPGHGTLYLDGADELSEDAAEWWGRRLPELEREGRWRVVASAGPGFGAGAGSLARRLSRFRIGLPPLRERRRDLGPVSEVLLADIAGRLGRPRPVLTPGALRLLAGQPWPRNLADLRALLERAVAYGGGTRIGEERVEELLREQRPSVAKLREQRRWHEREALLRALEESGGNISRAARRLGRSRAAVYRLIDKYRIDLER